MRNSILIQLFVAASLCLAVNAEISSTTLDLNFYETVQETLPDVFSGYKNSLLAVRLKGFLFNSESMEQFAALLKRNPNISELAFEAGNFNGAFLKRIPFKNLTQLRILRIVNTQLMQNEFSQSIISEFPSSIEHLEIVLFQKYMTPFCSAKLNFQQLTNLRTLILTEFDNRIDDLENSFLTIRFPEQIEVLDLTNTSLRYLNIFFCKEGEYELKELRLRNNDSQIDDGHFKDCLEKCPKLEVLDISFNDLRNMTLLNDIFVKGSFPNLKELYLSQEILMNFNCENPLDWLKNLNLKCLHFEGIIWGKYYFPIENHPFEELLLSLGFSAQNVNFSKLKKLAISSKSLAELEIEEYCILRELKIHLFPEESNYKKLCENLGKFTELTSFSLNCIGKCDDELEKKIFLSLQSALTPLTALKSISLKNDYDCLTFPSSLIADHLQLESLEVDIPSLENLSDWELEIGKLENLKSLSLNLKFNSLENYVLFENIQQFKYLEIFKFHAPEISNVNISKAIDKMPNLISLDVSKVTTENLKNFFSLSQPTNVRSLEITSLYHNEIMQIAHLSMKLFPKLNNFGSFQYSDWYDPKVFNAALILAELIPLLSKHPNAPIESIEAKTLADTILGSKKISPVLYENFQLRNKKIIPFLDPSQNTFNWGKISKLNGTELSSIEPIIDLFIEDFKLEALFKFFKSYDSYSEEYKRQITYFSCLNILQLIFVKKCMQEGKLEELENSFEKSVEFYVKKAKEFFSNNPTVESFTFENFVEATLVREIFKNYNVAYLTEWFKQNQSVVPFIAKFLQDIKKDPSFATSIINSFPSEEEDKKFHGFIVNYETGLNPLESFVKVISRYCGPSFVEFFAAIAADKPTEKDKEFLQLIFKDEKIDQFIDKIKEFSKELKEAEEYKIVSLNFIFNLEESQQFSFQEMAKHYRDFLDKSFKIGTCPICCEIYLGKNAIFEEYGIWKLDCTHKFHKLCMKRWIKEHKPPTCPMCRKALKKQKKRKAPSPSSPTIPPKTLKL